MDQELTQEQIDAIINRKLQKLENDYDLVKKYDDPNYQPNQPIQSNQSKQEENEQQEQQEQQEQNEQQEQQEQKQEVTEQKYNEVKQNKSDNEEEENEEFQDYQGYEQFEDGDEQSPKEEEEQIDFDAIEHIDPFSKPLDVEKIKQFMSQIELPTPPWAQDPEQWKTKFTTIYQNQ